MSFRGFATSVLFSLTSLQTFIIAKAMKKKKILWFLHHLLHSYGNDFSPKNGHSKEILVPSRSFTKMQRENITDNKSVSNQLHTQ